MTESNKVPNKLINEKSPYLLQHAYNPVQWFPWGDEAFDKAKTEDKPIFLSIGYSTCHWCHVMERESFEDEEVAEILNKNYVSIKVDREERPDIDHIYMTVCQALTGHGGWPLTIVMTPDKKPFFAGTYFPKHSRGGYSGIVEILEQISHMWKNEKDKLLSSSENIIEHMKSQFDAVEEGDISLNIIHRAFQGFKRSFDREYGGFGRAPKFPTPHIISFLIRYYKLTADDEAMVMVEKTLESMFRGGIYDHIGFGFSRYSTDNKWLVPHFEKMLYDNALLAIAYIDVYQASGKSEYAQIAKQIFEYVLREMTSENGGFYSAEDADSEGEEGKFYIWNAEEIENILGKENAEDFCNFYDIKAGGNFEGKSIPNLIRNETPFSELAKLPLYNQIKQVFETRDKRVHPYKDDKILTAWNGLMIAAMAFGGRVLGEDMYLEAAEKAFEFIEQKLTREDGRLLARYRDGESAYLGYIDDYAFLVWGLIELYEATFKAKYLENAIRLTEEMLRYFYDNEKGGFFIYGSDSEELIARPKEVYDGATPSGNSVATLNLLRLARITGKIEYEAIAYKQFKTFGRSIEHYPMGYSHFLMAVMFANTKGSEIVIAGDKNSGDAKQMINELNRRFLPHSVFIFKALNDEEIEKLVPFVKGQDMINNKTTAYICENFACRAPVNDIDTFKNAIDSL